MRLEVRCARCGHACALEAWRKLPVERVLRREDVAVFVTEWPGDAVVEVRPCASCGHAIARRTGCVPLSP